MNWAYRETMMYKLKSILDYRKIQYSNAEIKSYSIKELCFLINKYRIRLHNADKKDNMWYKNKNITTPSIKVVQKGEIDQKGEIEQKGRIQKGEIDENDWVSGDELWWSP